MSAPRLSDLENGMVVGADREWERMHRVDHRCACCEGRAEFTEPNGDEVCRECLEELTWQCEACGDRYRKNGPWPETAHATPAWGAICRHCFWAIYDEDEIANAIRGLDLMCG